MEKIVTVNIDGQDMIKVQTVGGRRHVDFKGCHDFTQTMLSFKKKFGPDIHHWPLPNGNSHSEILIRELVLKLKGEWKFPFEEEELCHCRHVSAQAVDEAVINGAHTVELASQWTGCSTACGTCRPDVERIIQLRVVK